MCRLLSCTPLLQQRCLANVAREWIGLRRADMRFGAVIVIVIVIVIIREVYERRARQ